MLSALCRLLPSEPHSRRYQSHHFWFMLLTSGYISVKVMGVTLFVEKGNLDEIDNNLLTYNISHQSSNF